MDDELLGPALMDHSLTGLLDPSRSDRCIRSGSRPTATLESCVIALNQLVLILSVRVHLRLQCSEHLASVLVTKLLRGRGWWHIVHMAGHTIEAGDPSRNFRLSVVHEDTPLIVAYTTCGGKAWRLLLVDSAHLIGADLDAIAVVKTI